MKFIAPFSPYRFHVVSRISSSFSLPFSLPFFSLVFNSSFDPSKNSLSLAREKNSSRDSPWSTVIRDQLIVNAREPVTR